QDKLNRADPCESRRHLYRHRLAAPPRHSPTDQSYHRPKLQEQNGGQQPHLQSKGVTLQIVQRPFLNPTERAPEPCGDPEQGREAPERVGEEYGSKAAIGKLAAQSHSSSGNCTETDPEGQQVKSSQHPLE